MNPIKSLAQYIYENQKKGFSDIEIIQLLEQSGWLHEDIEKALKKALAMQRADYLISIPLTVFKSKVKALPLKIKLTFFLLLGFFFSPFRFIAGYFIKKSKEKEQKKNSINELSKYIEKNLREGALESDIFVELLRLKWDKDVISKAFNIANSKILKENIVLFIKHLIFFPIILVKKMASRISVIAKIIFIDIPASIIAITKKILTYLRGGTESFLKSIKRNIVFSLSKIVLKTAHPKTSFRSPIPAHKKYKHRTFSLNFKTILSGTISFLKNALSIIILFFKKVNFPISRMFLFAKERAVVFPRFFNNIKYFIKNFPRIAKRLRYRFAHFLILFTKSIPKKILAVIFICLDFFRYDFETFLRHWFVRRPLLVINNFYEYLTGIQWADLPTKAINYLIVTIKSIFGLVVKILFFPLSLFLKIKKEAFNIPFEIIERIIFKIFYGIKKNTLPLVARLAIIIKSAKSLIISAPLNSEKSADVLPQSLVEVPIGKVIDRMRVSDILRISVRMFKTRRMRTMLTILGIGIGIGAVLFLVSLGFGLQKILLEEIATSDALLSLDISTRDEELIPLNRETLDKFRTMSEVSYISPLVSIPGQISLENVTANTMINGVLPNYFKLGGISANIGELFKEGEEDSVVISMPIVKLLNLGQVDGEITEDVMRQMIGETVSVVLLVPIKTEVGEEVKTVEFETKFKIAGVMEDTAESFIFFPLSRLESAGIGNYQSAKVRVIESNAIESVRAQAVAMGFVVAALSDTIEQANKVFQVLQVVLALFGIVALVVSAIGMFNTMTIALLERTQEIGIMKSLGASNQNVWELFLAESIIMGFLGGVGGLLVGYLGSEGLNLTVRILAGALGGKTVQLFERPWWFIITILVFSTVVGLFTGLWPARRAASIKILAALRYK